MSTTARRAAPGIDVITTDMEIAGLGHLAINAFVLHGDEPVLVDTGSVIGREEFMTALLTVIDPADLRWIWLTHTDFDHIGALHQLLAENPKLRVITTFFGVGIMGLFDPLPMDRVNFVNAGEAITLGDRTLTGVKPPAFDNPITTGFHDSASGALFSSDCFGALLPALPESAADLDAAELRHGQVTWAAIDSAWLHKVDPGAFAQDLDRIRQIEPTMVLSAHLPPAPGAMLDGLLGSLETVPASEPFAAPDQAMLEAMLAEMSRAPAPVQ